MTYDHFLMRLEQEIVKRVEDRGLVQRVQILKNNGVKLDGFCFRMEGHRERPTIYVNQYYYQEIPESELEDIAELVLKIQRKSRLFPQKDLMQMMEFEQMKSRIFYRLISREQNEELLKKVPWIPWLDLAIVFYLRVPETIVRNATALIHTEHMEYWGITLEEMYRAAAVNMAGLPVRLDPMESLLGETGMEPLQSGMYILSSGGREYGAAAIVDAGNLRTCFQRIGEDYYVLPSSVHEVILLPYSMATCQKELDELVQEVNEKCVSREEVLSSHAYFYSSRTGKLE